jgi:hypothetical protein
VTLEGGQPSKNMINANNTSCFTFTRLVILSPLMQIFTALFHVFSYRHYDHNY